MKIIQPSRKRKNGSVKPDSSIENIPNKNRTGDAKATRFAANRETDSLNYERQTESCREIQAEIENIELAPNKKRRRSELAMHANTDADQASLVELDPAKKEFNEIMQRGIRLLSMREHSVKEMHDKLAAKADSSMYVADVVDLLVEKKYLSDERFTESYIRARSNRGFGPFKIRSELKAKGISSTLIQDYLEDHAAIWFENAEAQYQKKYGETPVVDYQTWSKRARFLQSRGFTSEQIQVSIPEFVND